MMAERLEDYVDVAERVVAFHEAYPEGSLQTMSWELCEVGDRLFVVYRAVAYRTPDDTRPGHGIAWEPFPGRTPFTRDSELMNAETAAWGRAIVALGITASRRLASRQEVEARRQPDGKPAETPEKPPQKPSERYGEVPRHRQPSDAQKQRIQQLVKEHGVDRVELNAILHQWGLHVAEGWLDQLTPGRDGTASRLIDILAKLERPQVDASS